MGAVRKSDREVAVMYSGGLDSYVAVKLARSRGLTAIPIYVNLHDGHNETNQRAMSKLGIEYIELDMPIGEWLENVAHIVPGRNLLLAWVGATFAKRVWIAGLDGEQLGKNNDKSVEFYGGATLLFTHVFECLREKTIVETPFYNMSKAEVVRWAIDAGEDIGLLRRTWSCYGDGEKQCGSCLTCYKRWAAFALNGIDTTEDYETPPYESQYAKELDEQCTIENIDRFTLKRVKEHERVKEILREWRTSAR